MNKNAFQWDAWPPDGGGGGLPSEGMYTSPP